jgi:hypothetical protein
MNRLQTVLAEAFDQYGNPLPEEAAIVLDNRVYDRASRLVRSGPSDSLSRDYLKVLIDGKVDANGGITRTSRYDANGELLVQEVTKPDGSQYVVDYRKSIFLGLGSDVPNYDAAGNLIGYQVINSGGAQTYAIDTQPFDGYKEMSVTAWRDGQEGGTVTNEYDVNGFLTKVLGAPLWDSDSRYWRDTQTFVNDADGHVLYKEEQGNRLRQLVVNGNVVGVFGVGTDPTRPTKPSGDPKYTEQGTST